MNWAPGPWRAEGWKNIVVNDAMGHTIALAPGGHLAIEDCQATARLMAAAPIMLTTLESILHQLCTDSDLDTIPAAAGYDHLELLVRRAIAVADPGCPQLQGWHDPEE